MNHSTIIADESRETDIYTVKRPHGMQDWLITYTLGGEGYYRIDQQQWLCHEGDIALLKPIVPHEYGTPKGKVWHFVWAHFSFLPETSRFEDENLIVHTLENKHTRQRVVQAFKRVIQDARLHKGLWIELCQRALSEILLLSAEQQKKSLDPRIEQTLELLSSRMKEQIRIDELAKTVGLSPSRLSHLFKEETGQSIIDSVNRMRLDQAALLLSYTNRNAAEAALDVGFQNYNHFAAQFRKHYGITPREYKRTKKE